MGRFNLGNYLQENVFSRQQFKDITNTIGNIAGRFVNFGSTMMNNMLKLSTNINNWMGSSYFPIVLISGISLIVLWKLKVI